MITDKFDKKYTYYSYPNEPIGGDNPYWRCCSCGRSDPEINGKLSNHLEWCSWAKDKIKELENEQ